MTHDLKTKIAEAINTDWLTPGDAEQFALAALQAIHDAGYVVVPRAMLSATAGQVVHGPMSSYIAALYAKPQATWTEEETRAVAADQQAHIQASQPNTEESAGDEDGINELWRQCHISDVGDAS